MQTQPGVGHDTIAIVDFGSQFTQLIARRVRELGVFCRIHHHSVSLDKISAEGERLCGVILSGGPRSVYDDDAPVLQQGLLEQGVPVLGICYGLQATVRLLGGSVVAGHGGGEYGHTELSATALPGAPAQSVVWMSHGDQVEALPEGFKALASSDGCPFAAVEGLDGRFLGLQFHPEVTHTEHGREMLQHFVHERCGADHGWEMGSFIDEASAAIRKQVGDKQVICGLSGGVDSSTLAMLLHQAIGDQLTCVFVDNGLLRKDEAAQVVATFGEGLGLKLRHIDAGEQFLSELAGVTDPEQKRKIIGKIFIDVFAEQ
ncbi:MAG: GMP synthase (glutamine-hydrolyzing), partial [Pseudohongiellaceae bacterium]